VEFEANFKRFEPNDTAQLNTVFNKDDRESNRTTEKEASQSNHKTSYYLKNARYKPGVNLSEMLRAKMNN